MLLDAQQEHDIINEALKPLQSLRNRPHSCEHCNTIVFDAGQQHSANTALSNVATLRIRIADVRHGAARGCLLMAQMGQVMANNEKKGLAMAATDWTELKFHVARGGGQDASHAGNIERVDFSWEKKWIVYSEPDNPSAKWVRSREACRDFGEPGALKIAGSWLKNCISQHAGNCAHQSNFRPRRLIDTAIYGPSEVVKLDADTPLVDVPYATLSYCWGGDQDGKTLRANLALRMQGFNLTDQPKTIQDAITITRALGIRFVWVDSLCIVQDDDDDKVHEITRMHDIYRHSSLTISASRATSSQEGFLSLCKPVDPIRLGYRGPDGTLGSVILSSSYQFREPIHSRAWTLQEHSLSARLLIFGTFGMRWVCRAGKLTDGEQENASHIRNILAEHLLDPQSALNPVGEWQDVVLGYSARALTNVEDRLPALSAMATMNCAARSDDQYLAGLWMSSLPRDLLWHVSSGVNWRGAKRDQHAGFPSWSWASVTGPIEGFIPPGRDEVVTLKAINSEVELRNASAPFGQVSHGKLTLEGRLFVVRGSADHALNQTSTSDEPPRLFQTAVVHVQSCGPEWEDDTRDTATFDVTMDEPESIGMLDGCYCLEVISNPNNLRTSTGLLLRLTDNYEKTFTRIGHYTPRFPRVSTSIISWAERLTIDIV